MATGAKAVRPVDKLMLIQRALADVDLSKADVTVLAVLIEATNKAYGCAWPSLATIANTAGIETRSVYRITEKLRRLGYLHIDRGGRGAKDVNVYKVAIERWTGASPLKLKPAKRKGDNPSQKGDKSGSIRGTSESTDSSYEPSYTETFRTRGTAASCGASREEGPAEKSQEEDVATTLRIIETTIRKQWPSEAQAEKWRQYLEEITDVYEGHTGDSLGGWAYRLLDQLGG
jgi:hypothetical protein